MLLTSELLFPVISQKVVTLPKYKTTTIFMYNSKLPKDTMMLYSYINMKLRDYYPSLNSLCEDLGIERQWLEKELGTAGFEYSSEHNKFW